MLDILYPYVSYKLQESGTDLIAHDRQSKKLYAWETGPADDFALVLLCGEVDFKVGL